MARIKPRQTWPRWSQGLPDPVPRRRLPHRCSPRLEALEDRVQPGDTLLGVSVVALQAFASTSWDPPLAIVREGAEETMLALQSSDLEVGDRLAGLPETQPASRAERGPGWISDGTLP